jgi:hypothetical protein
VANKLKNGHPAHKLATEDRRKGAAVTNEIRRAKRELADQLRLNREIEEMIARDERRRANRHERHQSTRQVVVRIVPRPGASPT